MVSLLVLLVLLVTVVVGDVNAVSAIGAIGGGVGDDAAVVADSLGKIAPLVQWPIGTNHTE